MSQTEEHRQASIVFGELWTGSQDLVASIAILGAMLEREESKAQLIARTERAFDQAWQLALLLHETLDRLIKAEKERDASREQLQKIGRKAFWAARTEE